MASHGSARISRLRAHLLHSHSGVSLTYSIRVTGPHDDEDWLVGESVDGSRAGGFPKVCE